MSKERYQWTNKERDQIWEMIQKGMNAKEIIKEPNFRHHPERKVQILINNLKTKNRLNTIATAAEPDSAADPFIRRDEKDLPYDENMDDFIDDSYEGSMTTPEKNMQFNKWKGLFYFENQTTHFYAFVNVNHIVPTIEILQTGIRLVFERPPLTNGIMKIFEVEPNLLPNFKKILKQNQTLTEEWFIPSSRKLVTSKSEDHFKLIKLSDTGNQWLGFKIPYDESPAKKKPRVVEITFDPDSDQSGEMN